MVVTALSTATDVRPTSVLRTISPCPTARVMTRTWSVWDALCQANAPPRPPRQAQSTPMAMRRGERRSRGTGVAMCAGVVADMAVKL